MSDIAVSVSTASAVSVAVSSSPVAVSVSTAGSQGASAQNVKGASLLAPNSTEDIVFFYSDAAITISKVIIAVTGGGSIDWNIRASATRAGAGDDVFSSDQTDSGAEVITSLDTTSFVADRYYRFIISGTSGSIDDVHVSIFYTL